MRAGRPAPVLEHLRRPFRWLLVIIAFLVLTLVLAEVAQDAEQRRRERSIVVEGTLLDRQVGDGRARVRYVHPVTEQELTVTIPVRERRRLPAEPGPVRLDADPIDPDGVRVDGDADPATGDLGWNLPYLVIPVLVWGRRRWGVWRTERLVGSAGPSFAMLGAVAPVGRRGRRTELHLWPLDAAAGSPSLCRVGLLATAHLPVGGGVFDVEVKGLPRPFGRLVARSPETGGILWPAGAGLPRRSRPRPPLTTRPAPLPDEIEVAPALAKVRPPWVQLAIGAAAVVAAGLLFAGVAAVTARGAKDGRRVEGGRSVIAEVTARSDTRDELALTYAVDGKRRTGQVRVGSRDPYEVGRRYPATVDPADPSRLHLARQRYDRAGPLAWAAIPLLAGGGLLCRAVWSWHRARRLARRGGWRPYEMWTGASPTSWATLTAPGTGQAVCSVQLGALGVGGPPSSPHAITVLATGDPQPGGHLVVHFHGRTEVVTQAGAATRLKWWP